jgi:hypothetical protein
MPSSLPGTQSYAAREQQRQKAALPVLSARSTFCDTLAKEKVLIVTAETVRYGFCLA